jgi:hypothetical protein
MRRLIDIGSIILCIADMFAFGNVVLHVGIDLVDDRHARWVDACNVVCRNVICISINVLDSQDICNI